jgi:hypothetical protein
MRRSPLVFSLATLALAGCPTSDDDAKVDTDETDAVETDDTGDTVPDETDVDSDTDTDDTDPGFVPLDHVVPGHWDRGFVVPGFTGESASRVLDTLRLPDGRLVAAGIFQFVTDVPVDGIAVQADDGTWSPLAGGIDAAIEDVALLSDGTLLAAGWAGGFLGVEGHVWALDDGAWVDRGTFDGRVYALHEQGDGTLLVGGEFMTVDGREALGLAAWDGSQFDGWGAGFGSDGWGTVRAIFERDGATCVAGLFDEVDGVAAGGTACLDDEGWTPLGRIDGEVRGVATLKNGRVLAWGGFALGEPPDAFTVGLAELVDGDWIPVPEKGVDGGMTTQVRALVPEGDDGYVIGGQFGAVGLFAGSGQPGLPASNIARFDGASWSALGNGVEATSGVFAADVEGVHHLRREDDGGIVVGGLFERADGLVASGLAIWRDGSMEVPYDTNVLQGLEGSAGHVAVAPDGSVWISAEVATHGYDPVLETWDGTRFTDLHDGPGGHVSDLATEPGVLYVSGRLEGIGRGLCDLAAYDGVAWSCLVRGLAVEGEHEGVTGIDVDGLGHVALVGDFVLRGGETNVARWDGTALTALGDGLAGFGLDKVAVDPATGDVYVSGYGMQDGDTEFVGLARWDAAASAWTAVGAGLDGAIRDLAWWDGRLVIAGGFLRTTDADPNPGTDLGPLLAWDGHALGELGPVGGEGYPSTFTVETWRDGLFVWGTWDTIGGAPVDSTLVYTEDGTTWSPLGVGTDDIVSGVAVGSDAVWVVGPFRTAGGSPSFGVARWLPDAP